MDEMETLLLQLSVDLQQLLPVNFEIIFIKVIGSNFNILIYVDDYSAMVIIIGIVHSDPSSNSRQGLSNSTNTVMEKVQIQLLSLLWLKQNWANKEMVWFGLISLFNGISTFVGYLMPKLFSLNNSSGTI